MTKQHMSVVSALVVGATLGASLPARAQQVQVNGGGSAQPAGNSQPNQTVQVNNAPAQPAAPAPSASANVNVQSGEGGFVSRPAGRLMVSGATLFGVMYTATVLGAAIASDVCKEDSSLGCREAQWPIYLPIVGPFIQMGYMSGTGANTGRALLAIDGGLQAVGVGMFIAGAIMYGANAGRGTQVAKRIQLAPYNASGGGGLMAFGRF